MAAAQPEPLQNLPEDVLSAIARQGVSHQGEPRAFNFCDAMTKLCLALSKRQLRPCTENTYAAIMTENFGFRVEHRPAQFATWKAWFAGICRDLETLEQRYDAALTHSRSDWRHILTYFVRMLFLKPTAGTMTQPPPTAPPAGGPDVPMAAMPAPADPLLPTPPTPAEVREFVQTRSAAAGLTPENAFLLHYCSYMASWVGGGNAYQTPSLLAACLVKGSRLGVPNYWSRELHVLRESVHQLLTERRRHPGLAAHIVDAVLAGAPLLSAPGNSYVNMTAHPPAMRLITAGRVDVLDACFEALKPRGNAMKPRLFRDVLTSEGLHVEAVVFGETMLMRAAAGAAAPFAETLRVLEARGASVNTTNVTGETPLMCAVSRYLARNEGNGAHWDFDKRPMSERFGCVSALLRRGANPRMLTVDGVSAIHRAILPSFYIERTDLLELNDAWLTRVPGKTHVLAPLLDRIRDVYGEQALLREVNRRAILESVFPRQLLQRQLQDRRTFCSALGYATPRGLFYNFVQRLSPLQMAVAHLDVGAVRLLLRAGADPRVSGAPGRHSDRPDDANDRPTPPPEIEGRLLRNEGFRREDEQREESHAPPLFLHMFLGKMHDRITVDQRTGRAWTQIVNERYLRLSKIIALLGEAGADPNEVDDATGETALLRAARQGHQTGTEALLRIGAGATYVNPKTGETPVTAAVRAHITAAQSRRNGPAEPMSLLESTSLLQRAIQADPEAIHATPFDGFGVLHVAMMLEAKNVRDEQRLGLLNLLLTNGADPHRAVLEKTGEPLKHWGYDLTRCTTSPRPGETPLLIAARNADFKAVRALRAAGASCAVNDGERTVLHCAALATDEQIQFVAFNDAHSQGYMDARGKLYTPKPDLVKTEQMLYDALFDPIDGAPDTAVDVINAVDGAGNTPLQNALELPESNPRRRVQTEALLKAGADATLRNEEGRAAGKQ